MDDTNLQSGQITGNGKSFFSGPKIIYLILGLIIVGELIYSYITLTSPVSSTSRAYQSSIEDTGGKISLTTPSTTVAVNSIVPVLVVIDSASHSIGGADIVISYDPKMFDVPSTGLIKGTIFEEYPLLSADAKKGLISISGVSNIKSSFKGVGEFATINLKAKSKGNTSLMVEYKKDTTSDSNLVETATSKDILEGVNNLEFKIQ